jgi:BirA family transcriptional regulator, biotin operon repressor / biotin---[acetyl-CoA-carboxylase] ligase
MDQTRLERFLADLDLGEIRYFPSTGSTNDDAARWMEDGAPDASLVVAEMQTAGRGRAGRSWYSPTKASLSFSLVLYPRARETHSLQLYTTLGALPVCIALEEEFGLEPQIKWPNDVLVARKKICGVLAEAHWTGNKLSALILGVGINVARESTDFQLQAPGTLAFPAASLEEVLGYKVDRFQVLRSVLLRLLFLRKDVNNPIFLQAWEERLAFKGEIVQIFPIRSGGEGFVGDLEPVKEGTIIGLSPDGSLKLIDNIGEIHTVSYGEVILRPLKN